MAAGVPQDSQDRPWPALTLEQVATRNRWVVQGERPGEDLVLGTVGHFGRRDFGFTQVDATAFAAFDRPGHVKVAESASVRPYGESRSLSSAEARTVATTEEAAQVFSRYWKILRPGMVALGRWAPARVKAEASRSATQAGPETRRHPRVARVGASGRGFPGHKIHRM